MLSIAKAKLSPSVLNVKHYDFSCFTNVWSPGPISYHCHFIRQGPRAQLVSRGNFVNCSPNYWNLFLLSFHCISITAGLVFNCSFGPMCKIEIITPYLNFVDHDDLDVRPKKLMQIFSNRLLRFVLWEASDNWLRFHLLLWIRWAFITKVKYGRIQPTYWSEFRSKLFQSDLRV